MIGVGQVSTSIWWTPDGDGSGIKRGQFGVENGARRKPLAWSDEALTSVPGMARANGVNANLVFKWSRRSAGRIGAAVGRPGAAISSSQEASETLKFVAIRLSRSSEGRRR